MRLFLWFSNIVFFGDKCKMKKAFFLWFLSTMWKCFDLGKIECLLRFASIVSMPDDWKVRVVFWEILLSAGFSPLKFFFSFSSLFVHFALQNICANNLFYDRKKSWNAQRCEEFCILAKLRIFKTNHKRAENLNFSTLLTFFNERMRKD